MKIAKEALETAKKMPKAIWVAAIVLPGGFTAIGLYISIKSVIKQVKEKKK